MKMKDHRGTQNPAIRTVLRYPKVLVVYYYQNITIYIHKLSLDTFIKCYRIPRTFTIIYHFHYITVFKLFAQNVYLL